MIVDDRRLVYGVGDGLAHQQIVQRRVSAVDAHVAGVERWLPEYLQVDILGGCWHIRRTQHSTLHVVRLQGCEDVSLTRYNLKDQPIQERASTPVRRVGRQAQTIARHPIHELEGTGTDRRRGQRARLDGCRAGDAKGRYCEDAGQRAVRPAQDNLHLAGADRVHGIDQAGRVTPEAAE